MPPLLLCWQRSCCRVEEVFELTSEKWRTPTPTSRKRTIGTIVPSTTTTTYPCTRREDTYNWHASTRSKRTYFFDSRQRAPPHIVATRHVRGDCFDNAERRARGAVQLHGAAPSHVYAADSQQPSTSPTTAAADPPTRCARQSSRYKKKEFV
jgi:hypothetical protein